MQNLRGLFKSFVGFRETESELLVVFFINIENRYRNGS